MNGFEIAFDTVLRFMNLLLIPGLYYIIRLEKRLVKVETILDLCLKNKVVLSDK